MIILIASLLIAAVAVSAEQSLSPPYFDIAKGKNITATATCGEDYVNPNKREEGELFCTLAESHGKFGIKGISCSYCVPLDYGNDPDGNDARDHNIRNANDGSNRWWQSPPLSRGLQNREVNITIDLGQSFHVAYVIIKSANSPRPGIWALERSNDNGKTYRPWHYFAPTSAECRQYFGVDSYLPIVRDDTVICSTEYSQIPPFQDGEIHLSLINGRPGASNFSYSTTLQDWTSATNIRLRFLDIKTLLTDLLPLSLEDPSVTRRYYYSIKDISIGGRCMCNGFADECQPGNIIGKYSCRCQYNTAGERCSRCRTGYVQHEWRPRTAGNKNFKCEKCNCHGHSDECEYDEQVNEKKLSMDIHGKYNGGGVCKKCQDNTDGINCEKCKPFFYRPEGRGVTEKNTCQACNCDTRFSTGLCEAGTGQCKCKKNYAGRYCNQCNKGYHSFPRCLPCECNINGSIEGECGRDKDIGCRCKRGFTGATCDRCRPGYFGFPNCTACDCLTRFGALDNNCEREKGQCRCKRGYSGRECERCGNGYFQFPYCKDCGCDPRTTKEEVCEAGTGACVCKVNFDGDRCNRCASGYYAHPSCYGCDCSTAGSESASCDVRIGRCKCKSNYEGFKCDRCAPGFYGYPTCARCDCNKIGSRSENCDSQTGQCSCHSLFSGRSCDRCLPGFYGFPNCQRCNCNPAGTVTVGGRPGDCSTNNNGQCVCKANVRGLECNECKPGFFTLTETNPDGCKDCECYQPGTTSGVLSCKTSGQCSCKLNVKGTRCRECKDRFYSLKQNNVFGCAGCDCDSGGAVDQICSKSSGQCKCHPNLKGRKCNELRENFYFRDLHHIKVEMEEGFTPDGDAVRFDYQESKFPDYTWKGFVFINEKQPVAIVSINVPTSCTGRGSGYYEIVFRYVLNQIQSVSGGVVTVYRSGERNQEGVINFFSTQQGRGVSSSYEKVIASNGRRLYFRLTPGKWNIKIAVPDSRLLLDHLVLLPREYTEALYLSKRVSNACEVKSKEPFCNLYQYLSLDDYQTIEAETPRRSRSSKMIQLFNDTEVLDKLDFKSMVLLSPKFKQQDIMFKAKRPGKYVAVLPYYHDSDETKFIDIFVRSREDSQRGKAWLYTCRYTFGCRSTVLDRQSRDVAVFDIRSTNDHLLSLITRNDATVALDSIILVPYEEWNLDYATPKHYCVTKFGKCTSANYLIPRDGKLLRPEVDVDEKRPSYLIDPNVRVKYLKQGTNVIKVNDMTAGNYHIIVHYYQPNFPSYEIGIGVYSGAGSGLPGSMKLPYCPNVNGCRERFVRDVKGSAFVFEDGTSKLRFDMTGGRDAWIQYILFVPENSPYMNDDLFRTLPIGLPETFVEQCAGKHFSIRKDASEFCKKSVASITTGCNKGPASCDCNDEGSLSSQCDKLGGQCKCRPNVIGRTCTRCKIGFYGFPNCKPCNCSNCDDVTGRCTCAPGVTGDKCDKCKPGTFGYDPVIGCQPCNCDRVGTGSVEAVCNVTDGQCPCLKSFGSRKCSICAPGHYGYPGCLKCSCYVPGLTEQRCDRNTGRCFCQENVIGSRCSDCRNGFFETKAPKPEKLCSECWCKRRAFTCEEAEVYRTYIRSPSGIWKMSTEQISATAVVVNQFSRREFSFNVGARYHRVNLNDYNAKIKSEKPQIIYWVAPEDFLGNQVRSYGGKLTYDFGYYVKRGFLPQPLNGMADVIIHSDGITLHSKIRIKRIPGKILNLTVIMKEDQWENDGSDSVSRNLFLQALSNIKSLHIRATHDENTATSTLTNVVLESSKESGKERVYGVEKCNCNYGYTGLSCNECADGFTRQTDGTCGACKCSGKSRKCDPENGKCYNCTGNTDGDQCGVCKQGFYGDKCKPCECPSADPSNNFADSCSIAITTASLVCRCKAGYAGRRCEKCADGYFGEPEKRDGKCQQCLCSGNIDKRLTGNCDQKIGQCYKCVNNTFGSQCEKCRPGFYGDAVNEKNCKDCKCNLCGSLTSPCDRKSGQCGCKKNVVGTQCNKCKPNTWNFRACKGCEDCACGAASLSKGCDTETGQCQCKPTVIGKRCDWCKLGYYGYTSEGCKKCNCPNGGYCDVKTGSCDCGILGEKCTLCPVGHIIQDGQCVECDSCVQNTLNRVNILISNISRFSEVIFPAGSVSSGSLDEVNKTLIRLTKSKDEFKVRLEDLKETVGVGSYGSIQCRIYKTPSVSIILGKKSSVLPSTTLAPTRRARQTQTTDIYDGTTTTDMMEEFTTTQDPVTDYGSIARVKKSAKDEDRPCPVSKVVESTTTKFEKVKKKVSKLEKDAYEAKSSAKTTKRRAKDILEKLKKIEKKLISTLDFANSSLGGLDGTVDEQGSLKKAEAILKELKERDFGSVMKTSKKEKESAGNATVIAKELKKKSDDLREKVGKSSFKNLLEAFRNLKVSSQNTKSKADNASDIVDEVKEIDYKALIEMAVNIDKRSNVTIHEAKRILEEADEALRLGKKDFETFNGKRQPLAVLIEKLRKYVKDLGDRLTLAQGDVDKSVRHARNLTKLSDKLNKEIKGTKDFANTSLRAAYVYKIIVDAIYEALRAAQMANSTAYEAKQKAADANIEAVKSKVISITIQERADKIILDKQEIKQSLEELKKKLFDLKNLRKRIQGRVDVVNDDVKELEKEKILGEKAKNITAKAKEASDIAEDGNKLAKKVKENIKEDKKIVVKLTTDIYDINKEIKAVAGKVENVSKAIPPIEESIEQVNRTHQSIQEILDNNVTNSIKYIKFLLENARSVVDHIKLASKFTGSSSQLLVLEPPKAAHGPTINSEISLIFQHLDGKDALLLFMGNGNDPDGNGNGYLGFDINNNKVRFHYKANSASGDALSMPVNISNEKWYKLTATRDFQNYRLKMVEMDKTIGEIKPVNEQMTNLMELPILTLGPKSDVFVGNLPASAKKPNAFVTDPFNGCMDELIYDEERMGLWDWKESKEIYGCKRDGRASATGEYCFSGDGFVDFTASSAKFSKVRMAFRTLESNGLLILAQDPEEKAYFAVEMNDGYLVCKYDFGSGPKEVYIKDFGRLNDGNTYEFQVKSRRGKMTIKIDDKKLSDVISIDRTTSVQYRANKIYVGGVPMKEYYPPQVNKKGFVGCLGDIELKDSNGVLKLIDNALNYNEPVPSMRRYRMIGHAASFPTEDSYLDAPACSLAKKDNNKIASFGFTFQTYAEEGTLMLAPFMQLTLREGQVVLVVTLDGQKNIIKSENPTTLSDGNWHTVTLVNQFGTSLSLGTDKTYVTFNGSNNLDDALKFSGEKTMSLGGRKDGKGFNGNIREVYCSAQEVNLHAGTIYNDAQISSVKLQAPLPLVVPVKPTQPPTTVTPPDGLTETTTPSPVIKQTTVPTQPPTTTILPATTTTTTTTTTQPPQTTTKPDTTTPVIITTQEPVTATSEEPTTTTTTTTIVTTTAAPTTTTTTTTTNPPTTPTTQPTTVTTQTVVVDTTEPAVETTLAPVTTQAVPDTTPATTIPPTTTLQPCKVGESVISDGYGFGLYDESYTEFSVRKGTLDKESEYEFHFYTLADNGLLLSANMKSKFDYETIYLFGGKIIYVFNAGSGAAVLTTTKKYNDGKWHKVVTRRLKKTATLTIDDEETANGESPTGASSVNHIDRLYLGGIPKGAKIPARIPIVSKSPLRGGIKNIKSSGVALIPAVQKGVTGAFKDALSNTGGIFFGKEGGYAEKSKTVEVGQNFKLELQVRARDRAGYVFYASKGKDGLTVIIQSDGTVKAECDNGGGLFAVTVKPTKSICNGDSVDIVLVKKGQMLTATVDGVSETQSTDSVGTAANTGTTFYFGGMPANLRPADYADFSGCINNVKVNGKTIDFSVNTNLGGAAMSGCGA